MTDLDNLSSLLFRIDLDSGRLARLGRYYEGKQPASFMSPASAEALGGRLPSLVMNVPRLATTTLANRLALSGFLRSGQLDPAFAAEWRRAGGDLVSDEVHLGALVDGRSYAIAWVDSRGNLTLTAEPARAVAVEKDPATGEILRALKLYSSLNTVNGVLPATAYATMFEPDRITMWQGPAGVVAAGGWTKTNTIPNPLGVVPVVEFLNRARPNDLFGVSEIEDLAGLTDAISKLSQDLMVASELTALPRRVLIGVQIPIDPVSGQRVNPARGLAADNALVITNEKARVDSWPSADLSSYPKLIEALTVQLAALSGLPGHLLGLLGDQPRSADALRASEQALVERAIARQRAFGPSWEAVARLAIAITENVAPGSVDVEAEWADPFTRSPAADADSVSKLVGAGVPLALALQRHGWGAEEIARVTTAAPTPIAPSAITPNGA